MINYYSQRHQKNTESGKEKGWSRSPERELWRCRRWITFLKVKIVLLWDRTLADEALQPIPTSNGKAQGLSHWVTVRARGSGTGRAQVLGGGRSLGECSIWMTNASPMYDFFSQLTAFRKRFEGLQPKAVDLSHLPYQEAGGQIKGSELMAG